MPANSCLVDGLIHGDHHITTPIQLQRKHNDNKNEKLSSSKVCAHQVLQTVITAKKEVKKTITSDLLH